MKASSVLALAFSAKAFAYNSQQVLGSVDALGINKYQCNNGATPSVVCDDASSAKHNCSCTCTNGVTFEQPLDPFSSPTNGPADNEACQTDKMHCYEREQQLMTEKAALEKGEQDLAASVQALNDQLSTYQNKPAYHYIGCFVDSAKRVLPKMETSAVMTLKLCDSLCKGYSFFGLQNGKECFCGNKFENPTNHVADKDCSMACSGDKDTKCGAGYRHQMYARTDA